jgi:hypothetical protein
MIRSTPSRLAARTREQADGAVTDYHDSFAGAGLDRDRTEPAGAEDVRGGEQAWDQVDVGHARDGDQGADPSADSDSWTGIASLNIPCVNGDRFLARAVSAASCRARRHHVNEPLCAWCASKVTASSAISVRDNNRGVRAPRAFPSMALRHSFATGALKAGVSPKKLATASGQTPTFPGSSSDQCSGRARGNPAATPGWSITGKAAGQVVPSVPNTV